MIDFNDITLLNYKEKIKEMSHEDMCRIWRFAPAGHVLFAAGTGCYEVFTKKFKLFGGLTPEMSKKIGYEEKLK